MKISNSKKQLARIISENGGWRDGAEWAAQDKSYCSRKNNVVLYKSKPPKPQVGESCWGGLPGEMLVELEAGELVRNWHQTILSRDEYFHLYPEPDADWWIEWNGGECPVEVGALIDVKYRDLHVQLGSKVGDRSAVEMYATTHWRNSGGAADIIAYRLHKPEQAKPEFCESVMRTIPEPEAKPTIEQLASDYRAKLDIATLAQEEADAHRCGAEVALSKLEIAVKELGFRIELVTAKQEPELVITDWRDLRVGDEIEVFNFECPEDESRRKQELMSGPCIVMQSEGGNVRIELKKKLPTNGSYWNATGVDACDFKFIRRP
jgi:hypothetical protein